MMPEMPPIPSSSPTIEGVLADLAGAALAAWHIEIEQNPNKACSESWLIIAIALKQFENAGFVLKDSYKIADNIIDSFKGHGE